MDKIHIRDSNFFSEKNPTRENKYFEWVWDRSPTDSFLTVFTDCFINEGVNSRSRHRVAWLIEPPSISEKIYNRITNLIPYYEKIFTFSEKLLSVSKKFIYIPYGTTWIHEGQKKIYQKNKNLNIIASSKKITEGHKLRHAIVEKYGKRLDAIGNGYKPFDQKVEGLRDYRYSIVVENSRINSYFSEKLLDCFFTGTIPIYWGFPKVIEFFDERGIIIFNNINQLEDIIKRISKEDYESKLNALENNFKKAFNYIDLEKSLWESGLKKYFRCGE